jgi:hypothetical protein
MIRSRILGIPTHSRQTRRWFVAGYWLAVTFALAVLFQFPVPADVSHWYTFCPLLLALAVPSNLPLLLGGFTFGGAVRFYEGGRYRGAGARRNPIGRVWYWVAEVVWRRAAATPEGARQLQRFLNAVRPVDERENKVRDEAHHQAMRMQIWLTYAGAVAYLLVAAANTALLGRFGFVLIELLLVAAMSLPQSYILWTLPDMDAGEEMTEARA